MDTQFSLIWTTKLYKSCKIVRCRVKIRILKRNLVSLGAIHFYDCRFHEGSKRNWAVALLIAVVAVSGRVETRASSEFQRKPAGRTITHFSTVAWFAGHTRKMHDPVWQLFETRYKQAATLSVSSSTHSTDVQGSYGKSIFSFGESVRSFSTRNFIFLSTLRLQENVINVVGNMLVNIQIS